MNKMIINNWVKNLLAPAMKANGCMAEIRTPEDVIENMYYLSKEDGRGSRYIPLQYKRMIEKIICGLFNSGFEYRDKEDVYFDKIGDTLVCCANVFFVTYAEDGTKKVLGHGFHCLSLDEVMPGIFMSEAERASKWKATVIGAAKSRALYDAGIGLEFYGDIYAPEENLDEHETEAVDEKGKSRGKEGAKEKVYSQMGNPIPQPKKKAAVKDSSKEEVPSVKTETEADRVMPPMQKEAQDAGMSIEIARALKADCGNYQGMTLGDIYETAPKNLAFLIRYSKDEQEKCAAKSIIYADPELKEKLAV